MKKILVSALIAIMVGATLTGCGKANNGNNQSVEQGTGQTSSVSAKEVVEKLSEEELFMMPTMVDDEMAKDIYHLNLEDIVDYGILVPGVTAQQDALLAGHLYPEYLEAAENATIEVNGDLVSLFILNSEIKDNIEAKYNDLIK